MVSKTTRRLRLAGSGGAIALTWINDAGSIPRKWLLHADESCSSLVGTGTTVQPVFPAASLARRRNRSVHEWRERPTIFCFPNGENIPNCPTLQFSTMSTVTSSSFTHGAEGSMHLYRDSGRDTSRVGGIRAGHVNFARNSQWCINGGMSGFFPTSQYLREAVVAALLALEALTSAAATIAAVVVALRSVLRSPRTDGIRVGRGKRAGKDLRGDARPENQQAAYRVAEILAEESCANHAHVCVEGAPRITTREGVDSWHGLQGFERQQRTTSLATYGMGTASKSRSYVVDVAKAVPHASSIAGVGDAGGNVVIIHAQGFRIDAPVTG